MANGWSITTESVKNSAERVRDLVAQYETEYEKLYAEVENLRGSKWKGTASDAFNSKLEAYKDSFINLKDVMNSYYEFLIEAAKHYEDVEEKIRESASTLG
jgi:WXG100 family type VII secretion target